MGRAVEIEENDIKLGEDPIMKAAFSDQLTPANHLDQARSEPTVCDLARWGALSQDKELENQHDDQTFLTSIKVGGLDCADCAAKLETSLVRIPGVEKATVNLAFSKVNVRHRGQLPEIIETIEAMGYRAFLEDKAARSRQVQTDTTTRRHILLLTLSGTFAAVGFLLDFSGQPLWAARTAYLLSVVLGGYLPARNGWAVLKNAKEVDMNLLVVVAVTGAVAIGQLQEAVAVVLLFSLGNILQSYTFNKARKSIESLINMVPEEALVRRNGQEQLIEVQDIRIGDTVIVRPGERLPVDGEIIEGTSTVNQAAITGESLPVEKRPGDKVFAGSINGWGALEICATKSYQESTVSRIISLVEEAQLRRSRSQLIVDRFARYYTPFVIGVAVLVGLLPPLIFDQPVYQWLYKALALLLVACPCALVISTPVATVAGAANAAKNGILIKSAAYLEEIGSVPVFVFDKTGTLTSGRLAVTEIVPVRAEEDEILRIAASVEARSEHPIGKAIAARLYGEGSKNQPVTSFTATPGRGVRATIGGHCYYIGSEQFFADLGLEFEVVRERVASLQEEGKTVLIVGDNKGVLGLIALADTLREDARSAISELRGLGVDKAVMLTGDNEKVARMVASKAGVDEYEAALLPDEKLEAVRKLLAQYGKVAMVGDGVNDAPALAASTVGIAMGGEGNDAVLETADIVLMAANLMKLPYTVKLSRRVRSIIKQNIVFALALKGIVLSLVVPGWLTMWLAVTADVGASILVTLNSMRVLMLRGDK